MATGTVTSGAGITTLAQNALSNQALGQTEFLKLLTTELSNQDPTSPQDDKQFLAQMAQFSSVQGVNNLSMTMDRLQGASLVGKSVNAQIVTNGATENVNGVVSSVQFNSKGVTLNVNNRTVDLNQVVSVQ